MDPVTIGIAAAAAGGLGQAYNSAQARGASDAQLAQIKAAFDSLVPPKYKISISDPPELIQEKIKSPEFSASIKPTEWDLSKLDPETLKVVGKYSPEAADLIKEAAPTLIQKTGDMKIGRDAQLSALKRFTDIGQGEFDPEYQQQVMNSKLNAQAEAQSRQNSILQDAARRGQSGAGTTLAAQLGGASQSMNRNAMQGLEAASQSYQNRLNALSQGAQLGGQIQSQDQSLQGQNADMINAFNQRMSSQANQAAQARASGLNAAQLYNLQNEQGLENQNVQARNQASQEDRDRADDLAKYNSQFARQNQGREDDLAKYGYQNAWNERGYANANATQLAGWKQAQEDKVNNLLSKKYQDIYQKTAGATGMAQQQIQNNLSTTRDINAGIQGLSNLGVNYAQGLDRSNQAALNRMAYGGKSPASTDVFAGSPDEDDDIY